MCRDCGAVGVGSAATEPCSPECARACNDYVKSYLLEAHMQQVKMKTNEGRAGVIGAHMRDTLPR